MNDLFKRIREEIRNEVLVNGTHLVGKQYGIERSPEETVDEYVDRLAVQEVNNLGAYRG